jgi:hypothetical protein
MLTLSLPKKKWNIPEDVRTPRVGREKVKMANSPISHIRVVILNMQLQFENIRQLHLALGTSLLQVCLSIMPLGRHNLMLCRSAMDFRSF